MAGSSDAPHLPRSAPIEAYGKGGFAFADMSHRGSLLCLPDGDLGLAGRHEPDEIDEASLARVFEAAEWHRYPDHRHRHRRLAAATDACARRCAR